MTYEQAPAAFVTGGSLHKEGIVRMATRVLRPKEAATVLSMTDAQGLGDAGGLCDPAHRAVKRTPHVPL